MKNKLMYIAIGCLLGSLITWLVMQNLYLHQNIDKDISFQGEYIIPFDEQYLQPETDPKAEHLYVSFYEDRFTIKEGESFDFFNAVKETNGNLTSINIKHYELTKGSYLVLYGVSDKQDPAIIRSYIKLLSVTD